MRKETAVCVLLVLAVAGVFGQTLGHEFVNYDDNRYVTANQAVQDAFSRCTLFQTLAWAFTSRTASNWHPLTWLSHAADCRIYGLNAWGHHLTNVLLHAATAVLLFLVLRRMTGDFGPSAFCAALFALHPLRVESVAWVAERKDVLSGFFFVLTLAAYLGYARHPFSWRRYFLVVFLFALGLMSKPMLVTLPFVLLLLDYWPLGRWGARDEGRGTGSEGLGIRDWGLEGATGDWGRGAGKAGASAKPQAASNPQSLIPNPQHIFLEKLPLFILSAASCCITLWAQSGAIDNSPKVSLLMRLGNAAVSYVEYLGQFFCPVDLAVLYPHPGDSLPLWKIAAAVAVLAAVSGGAFALRRRMPFLLVGWLWYLGMLVPVVGLVQVGNQAMADRYTYLPQIGVCVMISWWGFSTIGVRRAKTRAGRAYFAAALAILAVLAVCAGRQASYWRNSETLWARAVHCTNNNYVAHYNLGVALAVQGQTGKAIEQYERALAAKPDYAEARYNRGVLLARSGRTDEAIREYRAVLRQVHDASDPHFSLAEALARQGLFEEAKHHYREAIRIAPESADAYNNLGNIELQQGQTDQAIADYKEAIKINPKYADARQNLERALRASRGTP